MIITTMDYNEREREVAKLNSEDIRALNEVEEVKPKSIRVNTVEDEKDMERFLNPEGTSYSEREDESNIVCIPAVMKKSELKVFLGGTCNDSTWREELIPQLNIDFFNPVVDDWTEECYQEEIMQRKLCKFTLYVITPRMKGVYSIAEAVDDSHKKPRGVIFCVINNDGDLSFDEGQLRSLDRVGRMIHINGGKYFTDLTQVADYLNRQV